MTETEDARRGLEAIATAAVNAAAAIGAVARTWSESVISAFQGMAQRMSEALREAKERRERQARLAASEASNPPARLAAMDARHRAEAADLRRRYRIEGDPR